MKTILVPTDFSENANHALNFAIELAGQFGSHLILFHNIEVQAGLPGNINPVAPDFAFNTTPIYPTGAPLPPELEELYQGKLSDLASQVAQNTGNRFQVDRVCKWGSLTENINDLCRERNVSLVVMGTQGASTFLERMIGTNTASFIQVANTPVLVIPAQARFRAPQNIAYAADLDNDERPYLQQLNNFADLFKAQITLVHVNSRLQLDIVVDDQIVNDIRQAYPDRNYQIVELKSDDIAEGLEGFVQENRFDMVAVAMHKRGFMESLFHSSVSEKLAYHTTVPLLTLPQISTQ